MSDLKSVVKFQGICVIFMGLTFLTSVLTLAFVIVKVGGKSQAVPSVSQEASPQITTNLQVPDELEQIERMAEGQGFYTRDQFAKVVGKSIETVDRWREEGRIIPEPYKSAGGGVQIPLNYQVIPAR